MSHKDLFLVIAAEGDTLEPNAAKPRGGFQARGCALAMHLEPSSFISSASAESAVIPHPSDDTSNSEL